MEYLRKHTDIKNRTLQFLDEAEEAVRGIWGEIERIRRYNSFKTLCAFRESGVANRHFFGTTGYGYSDEGREKLGEVFARIFRAEDAIVSPLVSSGTHALSIALFALLRPGDVMLSITGRPYDTLTGVIGLGEAHTHGSLSEFGIGYEEIPLDDSGAIQIERMMERLHKNPAIKIVYLQRSRGYEMRPAIPIAEMEKVHAAIQRESSDVLFVVDNCYGEFTERQEPTEAGADLIIGSLIKNPGGGIAPTGAYFAGRKGAIARTGERMTCAGIGTEIGSYLAGYLPYFQGIYLAPNVTATALQGAVLSAYVFETLGYGAYPRYDAFRTDITQAIHLHSEAELLALVRAVQAASPIDSNVTPYPWDMPGYDAQVVMAAGNFIQGGSIELSADAPIKEPYVAYMQGGLTMEQVKLALALAIQGMELEDRVAGE